MTTKRLPGLASLRDRLFKQVPGIALDLQTGAVGILVEAGIATFKAGAVSVNPVTELAVELPSFALRTPLEDLKDGDIVVTDDGPAFVAGSNVVATGPETAAARSVVLVTPDGREFVQRAVDHAFLGSGAVMAVRDPASLLQGTPGAGGLSSPLMLMAILGEDDASPLLAMAALGGKGLGAGDGVMQALLLARLLGGRKSDPFD